MKKINLLHEFFNSKSDASNLEALEQEKLENDFEQWFEKQNKNFEFSSKILIKHVAENYHPHTVVILSSISSQIFEGLQSFPTTDYLVD